MEETTELAEEIVKNLTHRIEVELNLELDNEFDMPSFNLFVLVKVDGEEILDENSCDVDMFFDEYEYYDEDEIPEKLKELSEKEIKFIREKTNNCVKQFLKKEIKEKYSFPLILKENNNE